MGPSSEAKLSFSIFGSLFSRDAHAQNNSAVAEHREIQLVVKHVTFLNHRTLLATHGTILLEIVPEARSVLGCLLVGQCQAPAILSTTMRHGYLDELLFGCPLAKPIMHLAQFFF